jgi:hypothetical protein
MRVVGVGCQLLPKIVVLTGRSKILCLRREVRPSARLQRPTGKKLKKKSDFFGKKISSTIPVFWVLKDPENQKSPQKDFPSRIGLMA